jgi:hypothetical protein
MAGFKRVLLGTVVVLLATCGPITLFTGSELFGRLKRNWLPGAATTAAAASQDPSAAMLVGTSGSDAAGLVAVTLPPTAYLAPSPGLSEVLNFEISPSWVMQHWPRVTTGLSYLQLQGYRVPLVTGTSLTDLAGSLTYYFDARQQLQRITFRGTTGNPSALVNLLASRFHFVRHILNDPSIVLYEVVGSGGQPLGAAKFRSAQVIKADQPYNRFEVELLIDRPE